MADKEEGQGTTPRGADWEVVSLTASALPVEGVGALCQLVHRVIRDHEEVALQVNLH